MPLPQLGVRAVWSRSLKSEGKEAPVEESAVSSSRGCAASGPGPRVPHTGPDGPEAAERVLDVLVLLPVLTEDRGGAEGGGGSWEPRCPGQELFSQIPLLGVAAGSQRVPRTPCLLLPWRCGRGGSFPALESRGEEAASSVRARLDPC